MSDSTTTLDYVSFHALRKPDSVALILGGRRFTYEAFHRDGRKFTRALREFQLRPGSSVAISHPHPYIHWLLMIACEELGLVSASFAAAEGADAAPLLSYVDLVLSDSDLGNTGINRFHLLSPDWVQQVMGTEADDGDVPGGAPDYPRGAQRIIRSSGTTGHKKMMLRGTTVIDQRITYHLYEGFTQQSCFLMAYPFTVGTIYLHATTHLRLGATCVAGPLMDCLRDYPVTYAWALPRDLEKLLDQLPADFPKRPNLKIRVTGAVVSGKLRDRLYERLAARIWHIYSTNETGRVSDIAEDGIGTLFPGVRVEVVDELDRPLPLGETGTIRVRTTEMASSYLGDPDATAQRFRNGWFYPGDRGILIDRYHLQVLGRDDEVLNLGGLKHSPAALEALLKTCDALQDVGVTTVRDAEGVERLCVAAVIKAGADPARATAAIRQGIRNTAEKFLLKYCAQLPRTDTGKLQRHLVKKMFESARPPET